VKAKITEEYFAQLLDRIKAKKHELNSCPPHQKFMESKGATVRTDAGKFGENGMMYLKNGEGILAMGESVQGKSVNENTSWQLVRTGNLIGFVHFSLVEHSPAFQKIREKRKGSFDHVTLVWKEEAPKKVCWGKYMQKMASYKIKGDQKNYGKGLLVYREGDETARLVREDLADAYLQKGGPCGNIGVPVGNQHRFGESSKELLSKGFQKSKVGVSQKFEKQTMYKKPEESTGDPYVFFGSRYSNCAMSYGESQVCCETPRGQMCHHAVSGGKYTYNNDIRTNNPDWEWHWGIPDDPYDAPGPTPRGVYNLQRKGAACKYASPEPHFTCYSYFMHTGNSARRSPPPGVKKPNGDPSDVRDELFFHPALYSLGCVTFSEPLPFDGTRWSQELPKWKIVTEMMDGGPQYGSGYMGGGFIGEMVVHE